MCTYRNIAIEDKNFLQSALHCVGIFAVPLNTLGAYIIIFKTPKTMRSVKASMILLHFSVVCQDMCLCYLIVPFIVFPAASGFSMGLLYKIGVPILLIGYIGITITFLLGPALVFFFEDRYNALVRRDSDTDCRKLKRCIHFTINYLFTLAVFIPPLFNVLDHEEGKALTLRQFPCIPTELVNTPGYTRVSDDVTIATTPFILVILVNLPQILFFFFSTAFKVFNMTGTSKRTSEMQKQLFKCLCFQVAIPVSIIFIPSSYVMYITARSFLDLAASNIACILLTVHGIFSTISMLTVHKPYRLATVDLFRVRKSTAPTSLFVNSVY